mmetsp:Transcript_17102/g.60829  ORF Transcript_17102/g.60829 Transcript_17102/m.60829 type:complete len:231 (-) Transcript_17102:365-1057(-)
MLKRVVRNAALHQRSVVVPHHQRLEAAALFDFVALHKEEENVLAALAHGRVLPVDKRWDVVGHHEHVRRLDVAVVEAVRLHGQLVLDPTKGLHDRGACGKGLFGQLALAPRVFRAPLGFKLWPVRRNVVAPARLVPRGVVRLHPQRPARELGRVPKRGVQLGHVRHRRQQRLVVEVGAQDRPGHAEVFQEYAFRDLASLDVLDRPEELGHADRHAVGDVLIKVPLALVES